MVTTLSVLNIIFSILLIILARFFNSDATKQEAMSKGPMQPGDTYIFDIISTLLYSAGGIQLITGILLAVGVV